MDGEAEEQSDHTLNRVQGTVDFAIDVCLVPRWTMQAGKTGKEAICDSI